MEFTFLTLTERLPVQHVDVGMRSANARRDDYVVSTHQSDPRGHVNTAAYLDLFEDGLAASDIATRQRPAIFELEFIRPSLPGDTLCRSLWSVDGVWMMELTTPQGEAIARGVRTGSRAGLRREESAKPDG